MAASPYQNESLARGFAVLEQIAACNGNLTLTEIANSLALPKPTVKRFLDSLVSLGYILPDPRGKTFSIAPKVLQLGYSAISGMEWRVIARPYLDQFYERIQETVSVCMLEGSNILYVYRATKPGFPIQQPVGTLRPAYASSMGKMLIALKPLEWQEKFINSITFAHITPSTVSTAEALRDQLCIIREVGYAVCDREVSELLRSVAVPILCRNEPIAALNVAVWIEEYSLERLLHEILPQLRHCAADISCALKHIEYRI